MSFRSCSCPSSWKFANNSLVLNISSSPQTCVAASVIFTETTASPKAEISNWALKTNLGEETSTVNYLGKTYI